MEHLPYFIVIALGALCLLLGFFIIVRGIGVAESAGTFKFFGVEVSTSKVGPGILFAMFGVLLTVTATVRLPAPVPAAPPGDPTQPTKVPTSMPPTSPQPPSSNDASSVPKPTEIAAREPPPRHPERDVSSTKTTPVPRVDTVDTPQATLPQGKTKIVNSALSQTDGGHCPSELMAEPVLSACRQQVAWLGPQLAAAGPVLSVAFLGPQSGYEAFDVRHSSRSVTWWALFGPDKRLIAFLPAQPGR